MNFTGDLRISFLIITYIVISLAVDPNLTKRDEKTKSVTTFVSAKWESTPIVLELAEYLYGESSDLFWSYVDGINGLKVNLDDLGKYTFVHINNKSIKLKKNIFHISYITINKFIIKHV